MKTDVKTSVLSTNNTFKTAFKATLGFYAAQLVVTVIGLVAITGTILVVNFLLNYTK